MSLLLAIYTLLLAIEASRSRLTAASIRLARRAPLTHAVALETRAVTVGLVAPDPVGHRQEKECPEHLLQSVLFFRGGAQI